MREMVDAELFIVAVPCADLRWCHDACDGEEDVEGPALSEEVLGAGFHAVEGAEIYCNDLDWGL